MAASDKAACFLQVKHMGYFFGMGDENPCHRNKTIDGWQYPQYWFYINPSQLLTIQPTSVLFNITPWCFLLHRLGSFVTSFNSCRNTGPRVWIMSATKIAWPSSWASLDAAWIRWSAHCPPGHHSTTSLVKALVKGLFKDLFKGLFKGWWWVMFK